MLHARCRAPRVHGEETVVRGEVEVEDCLVGGTEDARVAEHDVQLAVSVDRGIHEVFDLVFVCHVTTDIAAPEVYTNTNTEILIFLNYIFTIFMVVTKIIKLESLGRFVKV